MGIVVISFVVLLTGILGAYWMFVVRPEEQTQRAFWRRLKVNRSAREIQSKLLKQAQQLSALPSLDAALRRGQGLLQPLELLIEQSGSRMTVASFLLLSATCGLATVYLTQRFTGSGLVALGIGAIAAWIPTTVVRYLRTRRMLKFEEQFPEALALISRALKAGHTFTTGLAMVAEEMPAPIGPEFKLLYDQQNYGMPLPDALKEFARRVVLLDARFFVTAVLIQRESGGNLSEILDNIATVIRDRFRVKRQIRTVSAHARMTGYVLMGVPPALAFMLFLLNPEHLRTLTNSPLGMRLIYAAIGMQVTGSLIIRKMVKLDTEMSELTIALLALFTSLALIAGTATSALLARQAPARRRLLATDGLARTGVIADGQRLTELPTEAQKKIASFVPKSPKEMGRLQRRLAAAGFHGYTPVLVYAIGQMVGAVTGFLVVFFALGLRTGWLYGLAGAVVGYLVPSYLVARQIRLRKKQIQNGLPDALDLLIVSLEAGLAIDQAILKCSEELGIAYPALSHELQLINTETRAGKPRVEALKNFAKRTQVDDVRALVAMLVQTDRFGTSVAQALRTHAEESRVKRRQRAEERAAKLSVKLIFPLVFLLLPAFFVVAVGPGVIKFVELFSNMQIGGLPQ